MSTGDIDFAQKKMFGDYQTPAYFSDKVCEYLSDSLESVNVIIEPGFGVGNFISSALKIFKNIEQIYGIEINKKYYDLAKNDIGINYPDINNKVDINLYNEDIFTFDFNKIKNKLKTNDNILILGNPPWVTNSGLSSLNSKNLPLKTNFKKYNGMDAITGKGNFDITEYIIILLLTALKNYKLHTALLCKSTVARNLVKEISKLNLPISNIKIFEIDAKKIFGVNCDAVLLRMETGSNPAKICEVYSFENLSRKKAFGWYSDKFISNIDSYSKNKIFDGSCEFIWRQGIKHDCSKIFELTVKDNKYINGKNEIVEIEDAFIFPLFKSSDLKKYSINNNRKYVIITQKNIKQDTSFLKQEAPKLWSYLNKNKEIINNRKSIIYKNSPLFSMFGIGDYSFAKYKVAISGFYKQPVFSLIRTTDIAMLDDTCYFLGFNNLKQAQICTILLNSRPVQDFLKSLVFLDSKRPYTKDILMRIDISKICDSVQYTHLIQYASELDILHDITQKDYNDFKRNLMDDYQLKLAQSS